MQMRNALLRSGFERGLCEGWPGSVGKSSMAEWLLAGSDSEVGRNMQVSRPEPERIVVGKCSDLGMSSAIILYSPDYPDGALVPVTITALGGLPALLLARMSRIRSFVSSLATG